MMVLSAVITVFISIPFMLSQVKRGGYKRKGDIIVEEAEKAGRTVEATLKWKRFAYGEYGHPDPQKRSDTWFFAYQYTLNGKNYTYRSNSTEMPSDTIMLYYPAGKPSKAIPRGHFIVGTKPIFLIMLPVFVWAIIYHLLTINIS